MVNICGKYVSFQIIFFYIYTQEWISGSYDSSIFSFLRNLCTTLRSACTSLLFSCSVMSNCLLPHGLHHARSPCPSLSPGTCSNSCPLSRWCHPTISSSVVPFSSCLQSFPASVFSSESALRIRWPKYWSFSFSVSPSNVLSIQDWFPLGLTGLIFLQSKGLSRVFSNTSVQRHQNVPIYIPTNSVWGWPPSWH